MNTDLTIDDFKSAIFSTLKQHVNILEVAQVMKHTMNRGNVFLSEKEIKFKPLKLGSYEMKTFERLRGHSTPQLKETTIGKCLIWDLYAIRIRK